MKGLKYLLESTNFWNAVIGTIFIVPTFVITDSENVTTFVASLFLIRGVSKGIQDYAEKKNIKNRIGGTNPPPEKDEK